MFIYPSLTQNQVNVDVATGELISISNSGNEKSIIAIRSVAVGAQEWNFSTIGEVFNSAQTFGPYDQDRVIQIITRNATVQYDVGTSPTLSGVSPSTTVVSETFSIVEPAATFTTLTYETNAGNVRLVSAGAHGLTAAVSVGKNIYVTWASGTGVTGFYEVTALDVDTTGVKITIDLAYVLGLGTPTVAVANTAVTLTSVTIPGSSVGTDGTVEIDALFTMTNNATVKTLGMTLGGSSILSAAGANNASASIKKVVTNLGASQVSNAVANVQESGLSTGANISLALDMADDQVLAVTAQPATANNVIQLDFFKIITTF